MFNPLFNPRLTLFLLILWDMPNASPNPDWTVDSFKTVLAFAGNFGTNEGKDLIDKKIRFVLKPEAIQKHVFYKFAGVNMPLHRHLYFSQAAYSPGETELRFDGLIYEVAPANSTPRLVAPFAIAADEGLARQVIRAADELSLEIWLEGTIRRAIPASTELPDIRLELEPLSVKLLARDTILFEGAGKSIDGRILAGPETTLQTGRPEFIERTVLEMETEDASELLFYADWELDEQGWYGREIAYGCYGRGIAVVHAKNIGAEMVHRFKTPLPPGRYRIMLMPFKNITRVRENTVFVRLGEAGKQVSWFSASNIHKAGDGTWVPSPTFDISRPASELAIRAVQSGGGGINTVPEMPEMVIMLDRIRIDRIQDKREEQKLELEKPEEESSRRSPADLNLGGEKLELDNQEEEGGTDPK